MAAKQFLVTRLHKPDAFGNRPVIYCELRELQKVRVWRGIRGISAVANDRIFGLEMIERFEAEARL